jgi:serine/threonine-protein phosphatase 2A regulatory subunit A
VGSDDSQVREKAIQALRKISNVLNSQTITNVYLALIKRLKKGDVFSMRIAASQLYADIYARLGEEDRAKVHRKFKKLCADDTPMVRWGAA